MKIPSITELISPSTKKKPNAGSDSVSTEPVVVETVDPDDSSDTTKSAKESVKKSSPSTLSSSTSGGTDLGNKNPTWAEVAASPKKEAKEEDDDSVVMRVRTRSRIAALQALAMNHSMANDAAMEDRDEDMDSVADEAMSDFGGTDGESEAESVGAPPLLRELKRFGPDICRAHCVVQVRGGASEKVICGRLVSECNRHAKLRKEGRCAETNYYEKVAAKKPAGLYHGKLGGYQIGLKEYDVRRDLKKAEMEENLRLQEEAISRKEKKELEDLMATEAEKPRVQFTDTPKTLHEIHPLNPRNLETAFEANSKGTTAKSEPKTSDDDPKVSLSMLKGLMESFKKDWLKETSLKTAPKTKLPKNIKEKAIQDEGEEDEYEEMPGLVVREIDPNEDSDDDHKEDRMTRAKRAVRNRKRKERRQRSRRRARKGGGDDDPSSSSSSSSDSDSSDESDDHWTSSDESTSSSDSESRRRERRRRKQRERRRSKRRMAAKKKQKKPKAVTRNFGGADPSVGDKRRIFDMDIMGSKIDRALAPEGMKKSEIGGLADVMRDITSEPGMSGLTAGDIEDTREEGSSMVLAEALLATANKGRKRPRDDALWKREGRHALKKVKDEESLFETTSELASVEDDLWESMELHLHHFLTRCHYDSETIQEYWDRGLFPRLIKATYSNYLGLLTKARTLQWDHGEEWGAGPASAMIQYHSKKLLQIRMFSRSKKIHLLRTYAYLRDAKAKSFMDIAMNKTVWVQLANQQSQLALLMGKMKTPDNPNQDSKHRTGPPTPGTSKACAHCKSIQLHLRLAVANKKEQCPLKDQTSATAKKMARKIIRTHNADKTKEISVVTNEVVTSWSTDEG